MELKLYLIDEYLNKQGNKKWLKIQRKPLLKLM